MRLDTTTLPVRDALCLGRELFSLRRLLLGLELRRRLLLSMSHGGVSRGRFSGGGAVTAGDLGGVGGRSGDAVGRGVQPVFDSIEGVRGEGGESGRSHCG